MIHRLLPIPGLWLMLTLLGVAATPHAEEIRLRDAGGELVRLERPAERIVSLAPHMSELLFEIGAGHRLVGATEFTDYPEAAKQIPRVGDNANIDLEALLALKPDLVVGWLSGNRSARVERIRRLGIPVYMSEPRRLDQIPSLMRALGRLTGHNDQAETVARRFEQELERLRAAHRGKRPVSVFYEAWGQPLMTLNDEHLLSDVIHLCGGRNVFGALAMLAPTVSEEAVLAADPQVILTGGEGEMRSQWLEAWKRWPRMQAVKGGHLYQVDPDLLLRPTSRVLQGAQILCRLLDEVRRSNGR
ncbi:MAG: cobalamin-binding protein [Gammaproteobacteria bacterium]